MSEVPRAYQPEVHLATLERVARDFPKFMEDWPTFDEYLMENYIENFEGVVRRHSTAYAYASPEIQHKMEEALKALAPFWYFVENTMGIDFKACLGSTPLPRETWVGRSP